MDCNINLNLLLDHLNLKYYQQKLNILLRFEYDSVVISTALANEAVPVIVFATKVSTVNVAELNPDSFAIVTELSAICKVLIALSAIIVCVTVFVSPVVITSTTSVR